jgi:ribosomal protein L17
MTCYFRHLQEIFEQANIQVTRENRKEIDRVLHEIVGVGYKDCPSAWRGLKDRLKDERSRRKLVAELKARVMKLQTSSQLGR